MDCLFLEYVLLATVCSVWFQKNFALFRTHESICTKEYFGVKWPFIAFIGSFFSLYALFRSGTIGLPNGIGISHSVES